MEVPSHRADCCLLIEFGRGAAETESVFVLGDFQEKKESASGAEEKDQY